ncbi:copper resistance protein CopC [Methylobacillus arboreus]|uniref:copper resistance CopC family protein n=1 Tax=Methylobacillus arboreus TaxID=755170 RepID=UPI001E62C1F7|nr:copper resistance CopC family protein [Methylobacillus arboreus]MCB5191468.1 copper resistance protein CopC [Methylobacillus arboreus]
MLGLLLLPLFAWSHSKLVSTEPEDGAVLSAPPETVTLHFSKPIEPRFHQAELQQGTAWVALASEAGPRALVIKMQDAGTMHEYRIRWSVMARDGHRQQGMLRFSIQ